MQINGKMQEDFVGEEFISLLTLENTSIENTGKYSCQYQSDVDASDEVYLYFYGNSFFYIHFVGNLM